MRKLCPCTSEYQGGWPFLADLHDLILSCLSSLPSSISLVFLLIQLYIEAFAWAWSWDPSLALLSFASCLLLL